MIPINNDVSIFDKTNDLKLTLNRVESTKYLGIIIDQYFRWDKHIIDLLKRTRFVMSLFHKLKYILSSNQLRVMYYASFHSIRSHGILGWGDAIDTNINLIQRIQNRLFKTMNLNNNNDKKILKVRQTFYFFAIKKEIVNLNKLLLDKNDGDFESNRNNILKIPKKNKATGQKCYSFVAYKIFNSLPLKLKQFNNFNKDSKSWSNYLKKWLVNFELQFFILFNNKNALQHIHIIKFI